MQKNLISFVVVLLMLGCSSTAKDLYLISTVKEPVKHYEAKGMDIGVEQVIIPRYLERREISAAKSANQLYLLDGAMWAENLDVGLTNRLISFLQKKFQQPSVYQYPWDINRSNGLKIKLQVTRFIAQGQNLYLEANWEVASLDSDKRMTKLFSTVVATGPTAEEIVNSMNEAFAELEQQIAAGVNQF